tara:strand:+ start:780 stop:1469 length:690 start_codon:yes stop_codon:yes gene_type:complete
MDNKYYLFCGLKQIIFTVLNKKNEILFNKEIIFNHQELNENFEKLQNFLDHNIIEIEKKLKSYVKEINLIVDDVNFISIDMSSTHNFKNTLNELNNLTTSLVDLKNNIKQHIFNYEIIHLIINRFIIGKESYFSVPNDIKDENVFLEIRFICLKLDTYKKYQEIFAKYQINIKNILNYEYVNSFKNSDQDNLFNISEKLINGSNQNEILFINKTAKNKGFFEKFFDFFG